MGERRSRLGRACRHYTAVRVKAEPDARDERQRAECGDRRWREGSGGHDRSTNPDSPSAGGRSGSGSRIREQVQRGPARRGGDVVEGSSTWRRSSIAKREQHDADDHRKVRICIEVTGKRSPFWPWIVEHPLAADREEVEVASQNEVAMSPIKATTTDGDPVGDPIEMKASPVDDHHEAVALRRCDGCSCQPAVPLGRSDVGPRAPPPRPCRAPSVNPATRISVAPSRTGASRITARSSPVRRPARA